MSDVIIIGAGPAGISAALYTIRSGLETTVITAGDSALAKAEKIENYYGFAEPISGKELLTRGIDGAERLGVKFTNKQAVSIDYEDGGFSVVTSDDKKHECKAVLLATGSRRLAPSIEGLTEFEGKGVSYCAVCDAFFTETKRRRSRLRRIRSARGQNSRKNIKKRYRVHKRRRADGSISLRIYNC